jgi:hypothetical protein
MWTRSNGFGIATYLPLTHVLYVAPGTIEKDPYSQTYYIHVETYAMHTLSLVIAVSLL